MKSGVNRYRKRPVVIEAVQFNPAGLHKMELPEGVAVIEQASHADNYNYSGFKFGIHTLEGTMEVKPGDWVIKGVKGEFYPVKDDIFQATYDQADD